MKELDREYIFSKRRKLSKPNTINIYSDYAELVLDYRDGAKVPVKIDIEDIDSTKHFRWSRMNKDETSYAYTTIVHNDKQVSILLHRYILNYFGKLDVDHVNGDKFDNRKINLRACSHQENGSNQKIRKNNTSGFKGINWYKRDSNWEVKIRVNYKYIFLGRYKDLEKAIEVRKEAEIKYFKKFRRVI